MTLTATASASSDDIDVGTSVTFTCTPSGGTSPYTYVWETDDPACYATPITAQNPSHTFDWPGRHEVKVTVTDDNGDSVWVALEVNVDAHSTITTYDAVTDVGLDDTGVTDCSATFETWIAANYADGIRVEFPSGTYRWEDLEPAATTRNWAIFIDAGPYNYVELVGTGATQPVFTFYNDSARTGPMGFLRYWNSGGAKLLISNLDIGMENAPSTYPVYPQFVYDSDPDAWNLYLSIEDCTLRNFGRVTYASHLRLVRTNETGCGHVSIETHRVANEGLIRQCYYGSPASSHSHATYLSSASDFHAIDFYADVTSGNSGRLAHQHKSACTDITIRNNLLQGDSANGYGIMIGAEDDEASDVEVDNVRIVGMPLGIRLFSCSSSVEIKNSFFAEFTGANPSGIQVGHTRLIASGGTGVAGATISDNTFGDSVPGGTGATVIEETNADLEPWGYTESGSTDDSTTALAGDPAGWLSAGSYADPGLFDQESTPSVDSFSIAGGAATTSSGTVTLNISVSDSGSGMGSTARFPFQEGAVMQFSNDGTTWSDVRAYATTASWTLTDGEGTKTVYARFRNVDGYWSATASDTIERVSGLPGAGGFSASICNPIGLLNK